MARRKPKAVAPDGREFQEGDRIAWLGVDEPGIRKGGKGLVVNVDVIHEGIAGVQMDGKEWPVYLPVGKLSLLGRKG